MTQSTLQPTLQMRDVAAIFGVYESTVFRWTQRGRLKPLPRHRRPMRFALADVQRLAAERTRGAVNLDVLLERN